MTIGVRLALLQEDLASLVSCNCSRAGCDSPGVVMIAGYPPSLFERTKGVVVDTTFFRVVVRPASGLVEKLESYSTRWRHTRPRNDWYHRECYAGAVPAYGASRMNVRSSPHFSSESSLAATAVNFSTLFQENTYALSEKMS